MKWKASEDCRSYTGLTTGRVYEINMQGNGVHWASWELRVRNRARLVGVPLDEQYKVIGSYKNPATAMAYADAEEEEVMEQLSC